jgi:hypothetical protein
MSEAAPEKSECIECGYSDNVGAGSSLYEDREVQWLMSVNGAPTAAFLAVSRDGRLRTPLRSNYSKRFEPIDVIKRRGC